MKDVRPEPALGRGKPKPSPASTAPRAPSGPSLRSQGVKAAPRKKIPNSKAGPTGSSRNTNKRPNKKAPPVVAMAVVALAVVVGLTLLPRAYQPGEQPAQVRRTVVASAGTPTTVVGRPTSTSTAPKMNLTPAANITLDQISSFEGGQEPTLRFYDGSSLRVDPVTMQALRPEVRLRLTYNRSNK